MVNIGSIAGIRYTGVPYISYYTTKAAVIGFSRGLALEYAGRNIRSNVVMPGLMNTPMIVEPLKGVYGDGDIDRMIEKRNAQCPTGSMGDAWDVAQAAVEAAGEAAHHRGLARVRVADDQVQVHALSSIACRARHLHFCRRACNAMMGIDSRLPPGFEARQSGLAACSTPLARRSWSETPRSAGRPASAYRCR